MPETIGLLDLNITRLEDHLRLLRQQQAMSSSYPDHQAHLALRYQQCQAHLDHLRQKRQQLLPYLPGAIYESHYLSSSI